MIDRNVKKFNAKCVVYRRIFTNLNTKLHHSYLDVKIRIFFPPHLLTLQ